MKRLGYVDGLRALAALEVVCGHVGLEVWPHGAPPGVASILTAPFAYGHAAVGVFITLSGFCLAYPVARAGWRIPDGALGFYWRRAKRILPPYYAALALSLILIWLLIGRETGTGWDNSLPATWRSVLDHLLLMQDVTTDSLSINFVLWSIAVECQIYLLFPTLVALWRRYHPGFAVGVVVVLSLVLILALTPTWVGHLPQYLGTAAAPQYLGLFGLGMFAASIWPHVEHWSQPRLWLTASMGLACGVGVIILRPYGHNVVAFLLSDACAGGIAAALLLVAARPGALRAALSWRPLAWVGSFSYSLYLIHAPLIQLIWQYGVHPLGLGDVATFLTIMCGGLPLILLVAWLFWWLFERPFMDSTRAQRSPATRLGGWPARAGLSS